MEARGAGGAPPVTPAALRGAARSLREAHHPHPGATCPRSEGRGQHLKPGSEPRSWLPGGWEASLPCLGQGRARQREEQAQGRRQAWDPPKTPTGEAQAAEPWGRMPGTGVRAGQGGLWLSVTVQRGATDGLDLARFNLIHALAAERRLDSHGGGGGSGGGRNQSGGHLGGAGWSTSQQRW